MTSPVTFDFPDAASFVASMGGGVPEWTVQYATGEEANQRARYHGTRSMHRLIRALGEMGEFADDFIPADMREFHGRHVRSFMRTALASVVRDMTAVLTRCKAGETGTSVKYPTHRQAVFADGDKVLTVAFPRHDGVFADASMQQAALAALEPAKSHFVHPDKTSEFDTHQAQRETAFRHSACDSAGLALGTMQRHFAEWEAPHR